MFLINWLVMSDLLRTICLHIFRAQPMNFFLDQTRNKNCLRLFWHKLTRHKDTNKNFNSFSLNRDWLKHYWCKSLNCGEQQVDAEIFSAGRWLKYKNHLIFFLVNSCEGDVRMRSFSHCLNFRESQTSLFPMSFLAAWTHWTHDVDRQFFILHLSSQVKVGNKYVFKVKFSGPLTDDLTGFYRSSYEVNNQTRYATTQNNHCSYSSRP